ncbi:phage protein Gp27 family protein, partial [Brucella sp. 09RB8913]
MTRRLEQTREIAATMSERFDAEASDDLTLVAAEAIKTLIYELLESAGDAGINTKGAMELANALRAASAAQSVSTARRQKVEAEFEAKTEKVLEKVAKEAGLSAAAVSQLRRDFLGVKLPEEKPA